MISNRQSALLSACAAALMALAGTPAHAATAVADCKKIFSESKADSRKANPDEVQQCINRGWSPPKEWKRDGGRNPGIRVGGSAGFSYSTIQAPENPPGRAKAKASVSKSAMKSACSFPPRKTNIKLIPPSVKFPKGSCLDFFNGLIKDKNDSSNTDPLPTGVSPNDSCPAENDTTGIYGEKTPLAAGSIPVSCGGMMPSAAVAMVLNANPNGVAATEENSRSLRVYVKSGGKYMMKSYGLPSYLCRPEQTESGMNYQKTVDLTLPIAQMITYNTADIGFINIRLKSRATMDPGFIPPYDPKEIERYLVIPISSSGVPQVPADCADENVYFKPLSARQDITIQAATNTGCEGAGISPTPGHYPPIYMCKPGSSGDPEMDTCFGCPNDSNGEPKKSCAKEEIKHIPRLEITKLCPDRILPELKPDGYPGNVCPQSDGLDPESRCRGTATTSTNCDSVMVYPKGACTGKLQYAILDRPNLYYPPGTASVLTPFQDRTAFMADTVPGLQFYAQEQTYFALQKTAPKLTFHAGGQVALSDGQTLIMRAPSTIEFLGETVKITLTDGGQLVSGGGTQLQPFTPNQVFTRPLAQVPMPLEIKVGRNVEFPAGYAIPTAPKTGTQPPYIRLPIEQLPQ